MSIRHGVYVYEDETALTAPITADASAICVIGAAPVYMLDDPAAVTNVPVLATSATEAMSRLGYTPDSDSYGLCQVMYATANIYRVAPVVYINVLDVSTMKKAAETVTLTAPVPSRNVIEKAGIIKGSVSIVQDETALQLGTDYLLEYDADANLVITFVEGGAFDGTKAATVSLACADPSQVTASTIIGSYNASTGIATGSELIKNVYPKLGIIPALILAPGFSQVPEVGIALAAKAANINGVFKGMAVLDLDTAQARTYTAVNTVKADSGFTSPYCVDVWPCFKSGSKVLAGSVIAATCMAYADAENGGVPRRSPSNRLLGVSGTCLADGTEVILDQDQGTIVNGYGVVTAINMNGWRLWGSYTGAYPTTSDVKDMWIPVRRMFNWQSNNFILTYFQKVDDPLNQVLIESIVDSENIRCSAYVPDSWAGAEIQYLEDDNPETELLAGQLVFRQRIAPYTPAQVIENRLSYDTSMLAASLGGASE